VSENSLGEYITKNNIAGIDIFAKTGIPTSDISAYKNGRTRPIPAERIYLLSLIAKESLKEFLLLIYPKIKLENTNKPDIKTSSLLTTSFGRLINSLEDYTINTISHKTGITVKRLKDLSSKTTSIIWGHELLLIELATNVEPGTHFTELFGHLELNTPEVQEQLREEEKERSRRKKKG